MPGRLSAFLDAWIDGLAGALAALGDRLGGRDRPIQAVPDGDGWSLLDAGRRPLGRIDASAAPDAALKRALSGRRIGLSLPAGLLYRAELPPVPAESREFLAAIVEHRVDRVAPWRRPERLTGFRAEARDNGQIAVSVAVTARQFVAPVLAAAEAAGVRSIAITAADDPGDGIAIAVDLPPEAARRSRLRRNAGFALILFAALAAGAAGLIGWRSYDLAAQSAELQERIDQRMAILRKAAAAAEKGAAAAVDPIDHEKQTGPVSVIVIEALSRLLPDDTWLASLRYDGGKVRIAGLTRSLSRLVPLLVESPYFSDATFAEPTERQEDGSDRFSIELTIRPTSHMEAL